MSKATCRPRRRKRPSTRVRPARDSWYTTGACRRSVSPPAAIRCELQPHPWAAADVSNVAGRLADVGLEREGEARDLRTEPRLVGRGSRSRERPEGEDD